MTILEGYGGFSDSEIQTQIQNILGKQLQPQNLRILKFQARQAIMRRKLEAERVEQFYEAGVEKNWKKP